MMRAMALADPPLLLVSASPRRRRLLAWLALPYGTAAVETPEELDTPLAAEPAALASALAAEKADAARLEGLGCGSLVLAFDTIVVLDGRVLGKPVDDEDARRMLRALSGRRHAVVTGCALLAPGWGSPRTFAVTTDVQMRRLSDEDIATWMSRGEYSGCAGAYNIERQVAEVGEDSCWQNVAGLPLCHLRAQLATAGVASDSPIAACDAALGRRCRLGPIAGG